MNWAKNAVNQSSINQGDVISFQVFEPPLCLQTAFADRVQKIHTSKKEVLESLEGCDKLFQSLQQRAFTGELFMGPAADAAHTNATARGQLELFAS